MSGDSSSDGERGLDAIDDPRAVLADLFEHSPVAFQVFSTDGHCLFVNQAFRQLFGSAPPPGYNVLRDEVLEQQGFLELVRRTFAGDTVGVPPHWCDPRELRRPELGEARRVGIAVTLFPLHDRRGEICQIALCIRDVSAELTLRSTTEELDRSEERFRATFEQAAVGIAHVAPDGRWLEVNQRLCDIVGYTREELLERTFQDITHPADLDADLTFVRQMLAAEIATYSMEKRYVHKDGRLIWIELTVSLVRTDSGAPRYFISVVRDISTRKRAVAVAVRASEDRARAEEALHQTEEQLRQSQKMEAVGTLAGSIAHDFNNLLSVILGYADIIQQDLQAADPMHAEVEQIGRAARRANDLTRQLLAFSRRQVLKPRVVNLNQAISQMTRMLRRLIGEDVELALLTASRIGNVYVDPGQIEQVLLNLVVNARDAMPRGGKLSIETCDVELDAAYAATHLDVAPGNYVMLRVSDTGAGMDRATQSRIFEPFFTTKEKGTGLGLSTVFGIVKQSGGHIWVDSELEKGTTFKVYLRRTDAIADLSERAGPLPATLQGSETVLLVEDEEQVRTLAATVLRKYGYHVIEATGGGDALLICEQFSGPIHLLLTDVVMPRISGRQLWERLAPLRTGMKVLFMSGYTDDAIVRHGVLSPQFSFLQKPLQPGTLLAKVRQVMDAETGP